MSDCKSQSPGGPLLSSGRSSKSWYKAMMKAIKSLDRQGREICLGGNCAESGGGGCGFRITSMKFDYADIEIGSDPADIDYIVSIQGEGECYCS